MLHLAQWGPFKLIEECLRAAGRDEDDAKTAVAALRTLRDLRSVVKGHSATGKRAVYEKQAKTNYGSFKAHFAHVATECDAALELIIKTLAADTPAEDS